jgi:hypothetical protein
MRPGGSIEHKQNQAANFAAAVLLLASTGCAAIRVDKLSARSGDRTLELTGLRYASSRDVRIEATTNGWAIIANGAGARQDALTALQAIATAAAKASVP